MQENGCCIRCIAQFSCQRGLGRFKSGDLICDAWGEHPVCIGVDHLMIPENRCLARFVQPCLLMPLLIAALRVSNCRAFTVSQRSWREGRRSGTSSMIQSSEGFMRACLCPVSGSVTKRCLSRPAARHQGRCSEYRCRTDGCRTPHVPLAPALCVRECRR